MQNIGTEKRKKKKEMRTIRIHKIKQSFCSRSGCWGVFEDATSAIPIEAHICACAHMCVHPYIHALKSGGSDSWPPPPPSLRATAASCTRG